MRTNRNVRYSRIQKLMHRLPSHILFLEVESNRLPDTSRGCYLSFCSVQFYCLLTCIKEGKRRESPTTPCRIQHGQQQGLQRLKGLFHSTSHVLIVHNFLPKSITIRRLVLSSKFNGDVNLPRTQQPEDKKAFSSNECMIQ